MTYYQDYLRYMQNAYLLEQAKCGHTSRVSTGDYLQDNVDVYDVTDRRYAGINDVLNDLWYADDPVGNPKIRLRDTWMAQGRVPYIASYKAQLIQYRSLHTRWSMREWLYVFLVHRITGSAASYIDDHGYRNTIIPELATFDTVEAMTKFIGEYTSTMFTSIGCQIPGFPKLPEGCVWKKQSLYYLCDLAPQLIDDLIVFLNRRCILDIRDVLSFCAQWNKDRGFNAFWFQYSLFACDISDYYPNLVDPNSHVHYGTNSVKTLKLFGPKKQWDSIVRQIQMDLPFDVLPKGIENSLCDYWKYHKNWIPKGYSLDASVDRTKLVRKPI